LRQLVQPFERDRILDLELTGAGAAQFGDVRSHTEWFPKSSANVRM